VSQQSSLLNFPRRLNTEQAPATENRPSEKVSPLTCILLLLNCVPLFYSCYRIISSAAPKWRGRPRTTLPLLLDHDLTSSGYRLRLRTAEDLTKLRAFAKDQGDGNLKITFKSVDDLDVDINVIIGGKKKYSVPVKKGTSVVWSKPLSEFQGTTLYLDRWRVGLFGRPGTGGGSLLAWVPKQCCWN
jgi:hypothetical protein